MIIEFILGAGSLILDIIDKGFSTSKAKKASIAQDLLSISEILSKIASDLDRDVCPFSECSTMNTLTQSLMIKIRGSIDDDLVKILEETLDKFNRIEELNACQDRKGTAKQLKIAAGRFRAASLMAKY